MALQEDAKNTQSIDEIPLDQVVVGEREQWKEGPPYALFKRMRNECPVHWSPYLPEFPGEAGFHSITRWDDIRAVSMDWQTYSSELGGITAITDAIMPVTTAAAVKPTATMNASNPYAMARLTGPEYWCGAASVIARRSPRVWPPVAGRGGTFGWSTGRPPCHRWPRRSGCG